MQEKRDSFLFLQHIFSLKERIFVCKTAKRPGRALSERDHRNKGRDSDFTLISLPCRLPRRIFRQNLSRGPRRTHHNRLNNYNEAAQSGRKNNMLLSKRNGSDKF